MYQSPDNKVSSSRITPAAVATLCLALLLIAAVLPAAAADDQYSIVVSKATAGDAGWKAVVAALRDKHRGDVLVYEKSLDETLPSLRKTMPRYICFVARPTEAGREFVAGAHRLTRQLDGGPYTAALWGIVTGFDAASTLKMVGQKGPLVIHRAAAATEIELPECEEGLWYCELNQGKMVRKLPGGKPKQEKAPDDTTEAIVERAEQVSPAVVGRVGPRLGARLDAGLSLPQRHVSLPARATVRPGHAPAPLRRT